MNTGNQLRRVSHNLDNPLTVDAWPGSLAAVQDLLNWGDFHQATIFVGDNGVGKSTIVEALAVASGFPLHGGSRQEQRTPDYDDSHLATHLHVSKGVNANQGGFFLRSETMHGFGEYLSEVGSPRGPLLQRQSHGEGFLTLLTQADRHSGLWILDEPESGLSFQSQLSLIGILRQRTKAGHQIIMSTHSPILASLPGADLVEVSPSGLTRTTYSELSLVDDWRRFLDSPGRYHQHL